MADELTMDSGALIFATLADVYLSSGMVDEAISILKDGLSRNPTYTLAKIILGRAYYMKGDIEIAVKTLEEVHSEAKSSENTNLYLGHCYKALGDQKKAMEFYANTLEINPDNKEAQQEMQTLQSVREGPEPAAAAFEEAAPESGQEETAPTAAADVIEEGIAEESREIPVEAGAKPDSEEPAPSSEEESEPEEAALPEQSAEEIDAVTIGQPQPQPEAVSEQEQAPEVVPESEERPAEPAEEPQAISEPEVHEQEPPSQAESEQPAPEPEVHEQVPPTEAETEQLVPPTAEVSSADAGLEAAVEVPVEPVDTGRLSAGETVIPFETLAEPVSKLLAMKAVKGAFICSQDGLLIQNYYQDYPEIEELCAMVAAIYNESAEAFRFLEEGAVEKFIIEKRNETVCVITAGESLLTVITKAEAKPGLVFIYARKIIDEIREILG